MGLKTTCSNCGASFAMKNRDMEGKKVKCKKCGEPFVVRFSSGSGNGGGGGGMPAMGGLPPKVVGSKAPRQVKPLNTEEAPASSPSPAGPGHKKIMIIGGAVVGLLVIWTGVMVAIGSKGETQTSAPEQVELKLTRGKSTQGRFGVDYPADWEFKAAGGSGGKPESVLIKGDGVTISVRTNLKASALGDISSAGGTIQDGDMPEELEPIAKVHEAMMGDMKVDMSPYDEEPAEKIMAKAGNSRLSKFVGDRGLLNGGKTYGFRATMPAGTEKLKVVITCDSEKIFNKYEKMLRDVVMSIGPP